ncbi:MAG TPA: hypothetical protein VFZ28_12745 [Burkholderiaceae bacterium]|nr:hypothetical protein [Burkholderiaceae bacterium]
MQFLVEYDRRKGQLVRLRRYDVDQAEHAQDDRLEAELAHFASQEHIEVVLLEADAEEALRRTHRRYFEELRELATPHLEPVAEPSKVSQDEP